MNFAHVNATFFTMASRLLRDILSKKYTDTNYKMTVFVSKLVHMGNCLVIVFNT